MQLRIHLLVLLGLVIGLFVPSALVEVSARDEMVAIVKVNCAHGETINTALKQHPNAVTLILMNTCMGVPPWAPLSGNEKCLQ